MEYSNIITLEFGHTPNSPIYDRAVQIAKSNSTYKQEGRDHQLRHLVSLNESEIVQGWKSSRVTRGSFSDNAKGNIWIFRCYIERCKAIDKEAHCFFDNWIGCLKVRDGDQLTLSRGLGRFVSKDIFEPNKEGIRQNVIKESIRLELCPAFSMDRINIQIESLPSTINLPDNQEWVPIIEPEYETGVNRLTGISLKPKMDITKGPEIESIDELDSFGVQRYGNVFNYKDSWEHKIICIGEAQWIEAAHNGINPQITDLGEKGWQLLTVIQINQGIHCVLQRKRPG
jgi:hypothetical protein